MNEFTPVPYIPSPPATDTIVTSSPKVTESTPADSPTFAPIATKTEVTFPDTIESVEDSEVTMFLMRDEVLKVKANFSQSPMKRILYWLDSTMPSSIAYPAEISFPGAL
jgi:hypothetical protein